METEDGWFASENNTMDDQGKPAMDSNYQSYWGLYCSQCGVWLKNYNSGDPIYFPSPMIPLEILREEGEDMIDKWATEHLWQVTEFGKAERLRQENLPAGALICPGLHRHV